MSIAVMTEVWKDAPVSGTELLMLLALADSANDDRECWPSVRHLMHKVRLSEAQARRVLKSLERQGVIEIDIKKGKGATGRESNRYRICALTPLADDTSGGITDEPLNHHRETSIENSPKPPKGAKVIPAKYPNSYTVAKWTDAHIAQYSDENAEGLEALIVARDEREMYPTIKNMPRRDALKYIEALEELTRLGCPSQQFESLAVFTRAKLSWRRYGFTPLDMVDMYTDWRKSRESELHKKLPLGMTEIR